MSSKTGEKLGAVKRTDAWGVPPEKLVSPRADPKHPEHAEYLERTSRDNPKTAALIESMRQNGTDEGVPIIVYSDGGKTLIADGDRRHFCATYVNRERAALPKAQRKPPLVLRAVTTKDPVAARQMANACRQDDPPSVLARRYREACASMEPAAAAACNGLRLDTANMLLKCLSAGLSAEVWTKINNGEMPLDVAIRAAKRGAAGADEALAKSVDPATGKVDPKKAKAAAVELGGIRPRARPRQLLERMAKGLGKDPAAALLRWALGDDGALKGHEALLAAAGDAGWKAGR